MLFRSIYGVAGCFFLCLAFVCIYLAVDIYTWPARLRVGGRLRISKLLQHNQSPRSITARGSQDNAESRRDLRGAHANGFFHAIRSHLSEYTVPMQSALGRVSDAFEGEPEEICSGIWGDPGCPGQDATMGEQEVNSILTGEATVKGKVEKMGMLPPRKWLPPQDPVQMQNALHEWMWQHALGTSDGVLHPLPRGVAPPKAAICTLLFNPIYKFILIKNTKVAGTSVFVHLGGHCKAGISLEEARAGPPCLWRITDMTRVGVKKLGYETLEELWADYSVMTLVRNPYERAGSSYDYILGRREEREGHCRDPKFEHFAARPYVMGMQDQLFGCGDAVHDFYHVEPQHTCLLDDADRLVVDHIIRVKSLEEDFGAAVATINARLPEDVPPLNASVGWEQQGPLAQAADAAAQAPGRSRHVQKFAACGPRCLGLVHDYYKKDFELLQYPIGNITASPQDLPKGLPGKNTKAQARG